MLYRIDSEGHTEDGAGRKIFQDTERPGTRVAAAWLNAGQESICRFIERVGGAPYPNAADAASDEYRLFGNILLSRFNRKLFANLEQVAGSSGGEETLRSFNIPANTFLVPSEMLRVRVRGAFLSTETTRTIRIRIDGEVAFSFSGSFTGGNWVIDLTAERRSPGFRCVGHVIRPAGAVTFDGVDPIAVDVGAVIPVTVTAESTTDAPGNIVRSVEGDFVSA
jgi:hypothetical protein